MISGHSACVAAARARAGCMYSRRWDKARESVEVKLLEQSDELYILAKSSGRLHKERAMSRRKLKRLWKRLHKLSIVVVCLVSDANDLEENGYE